MTTIRLLGIVKYLSGIGGNKIPNDKTSAYPLTT